jgi:tRNA dimethylallyltransferase
MAVATSRDDVEIVSVDSMCVYRSMDLATAKPSLPDRAAVPHHLVDIVDPSEEYTVSQFQRAAATALDGIGERGHRALLVGGTGLHHRAVVDGLRFPGRFPDVAAALEEAADRLGGLDALFERLVAADPVAASRTGRSNRRRIVRALEVIGGTGERFSSFGPGLTTYPPTPVEMVGVPFDPDAVDRRIAERFDAWIAAGLVDEVATLARRPGGLSRTARQALGYREILAHVEDGVPLAECVAAAVRRTRSFARRQWRWFRRDPRIRWIGPGQDPVAVVAAAVAAAGPRRPHGGPVPDARIQV